TIRLPPRPPLFPYTTLFRSHPGKPRDVFSARMLIVVQHEPAEGPGNLTPFLPDARVVRTFSGDPLPEECDALVVLGGGMGAYERSEEHTSELQSQSNLVCRL